MSNIHCIDTNRTEIIKQETQQPTREILVLWWITWTHYFQSVLLHDISNALHLCKYSESRSEVTVGWIFVVENGKEQVYDHEAYTTVHITSTQSGLTGVNYSRWTVLLPNWLRAPRDGQLLLASATKSNACEITASNQHHSINNLVLFKSTHDAYFLKYKFRLEVEVFLHTWPIYASLGGEMTSPLNIPYELITKGDKCYPNDQNFRWRGVKQKQQHLTVCPQKFKFYTHDSNVPQERKND